MDTLVNMDQSPMVTFNKIIEYEFENEYESKLKMRTYC